MVQRLGRVECGEHESKKGKTRLDGEGYGGEEIGIFIDDVGVTYCIEFGFEGVVDVRWFTLNLCSALAHPMFNLPG